MPELRSLVCNALRNSGVDALERTDRFIALVLDELDQKSIEARLMSFGCDDQYLSFYASATKNGSAEAVARAADQACAYLREAYLLDAEISRRVSREIASGVADYLSISLVNPDNSEIASLHHKSSLFRHAAGILRFAAVVVLAACVSIAIVAHFTPIFGSTLLPAKESVNGVNFEKYLVNGSDGPVSVFFITNSASERMLVSVPKDVETRYFNYSSLGTGEKGIQILKGETNPSVLRIAPSEKNAFSQDLDWCIRQADGKTVLVIDNQGDEPIRLAPHYKQPSIAIATKGMFCRYYTISGDLLLEQGENEITLEGTGSEIALDPSCEVYVRGVRLSKTG